MTCNEQRRKALSILDRISDWEEYKTIIEIFTTVGIFTEFEVFMFTWNKCEKLKEKGLI